LETIFQSIEILSKEKGIDPQIVLDAVKDAMLIAARKRFRDYENGRPFRCGDVTTMSGRPCNHERALTPLCRGDNINRT
jgi:hypothetical protein